MVCKPQNNTKINHGIKGRKVLETSNLALQHWKATQKPEPARKTSKPRSPTASSVPRLTAAFSVLNPIQHSRFLSLFPFKLASRCSPQLTALSAMAMHYIKEIVPSYAKPLSFRIVFSCFCCCGFITLVFITLVFSCIIGTPSHRYMQMPNSSQHLPK